MDLLKIVFSDFLLIFISIPGWTQSGDALHRATDRLKNCKYSFWKYFSIAQCSQVSWIKKQDGAILSVDDMLVKYDERIEIEKKSYLSQWNLKIK